jgi:hypothetical protein
MNYKNSGEKDLNTNEKGKEQEQEQEVNIPSFSIDPDYDNIAVPMHSSIIKNLEDNKGENASAQSNNSLKKKEDR